MARQRRPQRWLRIRSIGVVSAFKLGCFFAAVPTFLFLIGACSILTGLVPNITIQDRAGVTRSYGMSLGNIIAIIPALIIIGVFVSIGPGISLAIQAVLYNAFGRFFGGVIIRVDAATIEEIEPGHNDFRDEPPPKQKNMRDMSEEEFVRARLEQRKRSLLQNDPNVREL